MVEMVIRLIIIFLFSASVCILLYAWKTKPYTAHLPGIIVWCLHVIVFTTVALFNAVDILCIDVYHLNLWSNIIRIHGGIVMVTTGWYYASTRKELLL